MYFFAIFLSFKESSLYVLIYFTAIKFRSCCLSFQCICIILVNIRQIDGKVFLLSGGSSKYTYSKFPTSQSRHIFVYYRSTSTRKFIFTLRRDRVLSISKIVSVRRWRCYASQRTRVPSNASYTHIRLTVCQFRIKQAERSHMRDTFRPPSVKKITFIWLTLYFYAPMTM